MQTSTTPVSTLYSLRTTWLSPDVLEKATLWLKDNFKEEDAHWEYFECFTLYPAAIYFKNEEDYLVFKLKFNELIRL